MNNQHNNIFWLDKPMILLNTFDKFIPTKSMTTIQQMNAITLFCVYALILLKVVDLDNKFIEFNQSKALGGREGSQKKRSTIKYKIKVIAWKQINLKEIQSMKPILNMSENEKFNYLNKML